jgi:hypothetical protein
VLVGHTSRSTLDSNALKSGVLIFTSLLRKNHNVGFDVTLRYKQHASAFSRLVCKQRPIEAEMESFTISGRDVATMRRMLTNSHVISLGTMQWRVFELTQLLNGLIARQDIFADVR